jgi:hypothetical protein
MLKIRTQDEKLADIRHEIRAAMQNIPSDLLPGN